MSYCERHFLMVSLDICKEHEGLLNEVYNDEHVPALIRVPGVRSIRRYQRIPLRLSIGGRIVEIDYDKEPKYTAIYEVDSPSVLTTNDWADAVELGRWPSDVRPLTLNRRHTLHKLITQSSKAIK